MELKELYKESTEKTPQIDLNNITGELIISGKSIPENAYKIYNDVLLWVTEYSKNPRHTTNLRLNLEYFNTASALWFAKIVKALCSMKGSDYTVMIHIYFDVEDYDAMDSDDIKDELQPIIDILGNITISLGIKLYGIDDDGKVLKESLVLI